MDLKNEKAENWDGYTSGGVSLRWECLTNSIIPLLEANLQLWKPQKEELLKSQRHLNRREREDLFSLNNWQRQSTVGKLCEYAIYDRLVGLSQDTDEVSGLTAKGSDIPRNYPRSRGEVGQNGLFYSWDNSLYLRGDGRDLTEFDIILKGCEGALTFVEVSNTKINLKDVAAEADYKRVVAELIFGQKRTDFVLVSPRVTRENPNLGTFLSNPENHFVAVPQLLDAIRGLPSKHLVSNFYPTNPSSKLMLISNLEIKPFDYKALHERIRNYLVDGAKNHTDLNLLIREAQRSIVKNMLVGELTIDALDYLLVEKELTISKLDRLSKFNFGMHFRKAVLGISLPQLRPVIYLRQRNKDNYWKMGPSSLSTFEPERNVERKGTTFFNSLESCNSVVDSNLVNLILHYYIRENVVGRRMKKPQSFHLS